MLKKIITALIFLLLGAGVYYAWLAFPIISGYGAKNLCSCVFISKRGPQSVIDQELGSGFLALGHYEVNRNDSSASGSVFGFAKRKAVFRKGLGCALAVETTALEVKKLGNNTSTHTLAIPLSDTLAWPAGDKIRDTLPPGFDRSKLQRAIEWAFEETNLENPKNTRTVLVVYKGQLVAERYSAGFDANTPQLGWSMTKSVTNAVVGILVRKGLVNLHNPVMKYMKQDVDLGRITTDQLLRMSSGLSWQEFYAGPSTATTMLFKKADMGLYAANQEAEHEPNEQWYYSSGTSNLLSLMIRNVLRPGQYHEFPARELFRKIGMHSAVLEADAGGTFVGSSYMYATARDWARFGLLYLQDGKWEGERILPEGWVAYSTTPTPGAPKGEYGAHFWLNAGEKNNPDNRWYPDAPTDLFSANGYEGQRVFIIPSKDLVIVRLGLSKRGSFDFNEFLKRVLEAVEG